MRKVKFVRYQTRLLTKYYYVKFVTYPHEWNQNIIIRSFNSKTNATLPVRNNYRLYQIHKRL